MSEDREEVARVGCLCGLGHILVEKCAPDPDYPRPVSSYYDVKLVCSECEREYALESPGLLHWDRVEVVRKVDQEKREQLRRDTWDRTRELLGGAGARAAMSRSVGPGAVLCGQHGGVYQRRGGVAGSWLEADGADSKGFR